MGFFDWLRRRRTHSISRRIFTDDQHVALIDRKTGTTLWRVEWGDIKQIVAWKDDVFVYDIISIGFFTENERYRCDEEDEGYRGLLLTMERTVGVRESDWWERVVQPPFKTNWTVLWKSAEATLPGG